MRLIDAEVLKKDIESFNRPLCDDYHMRSYVLDQIITDIENAPTINAVPVRHGRWIPCENDKWSNGVYALRCSECGRGYHLTSDKYICAWNYCPDCGAGMDEK